MDVKNKRILVVIIVVIVIFSCLFFFFGGEIILKNKKKNDIVMDSIPNKEVSTKVSLILPDSVEYIGYFLNFNYNELDSIKIVNGEATAELNTHSHSFINFFIKDNIVAALISDGSEVELDLVNNDIKASDLNEEFFKIRKDEEKAYVKPLERLYNEYFTLSKDDEYNRNKLNIEIEELEKKHAESFKNIALNNKKNVIPAYTLSQIYYSYKYDELSQLLDSSAVYASHPILYQAKEHLNGLYKRRNGIKYTDVTMKDTEGKDVSLSNWVGKGNYVFVDFWASWCAPCRGELPYILEAYNKYHESEGFDVVGISVDQHKENWIKCINNNSLPWHHMSELSGRDGIVKKLYGVGAIPCSILIDPEGTIIDSDLRGEALMERLDKIYNK